MQDSKQINKFLDFVTIYKRPHILAIMCLGFSCGIPFLLIVSTLPLWLKYVQCDMQQIGNIFLISIPYSFKFLYAPLIDQFPVPILTKKLGKRRSWAIVAQILLCISILLLGCTHPEKNIYLTTILAFMVSFFASTQDIVIDAYRIERLSKAELAIGTSMSGVGFRVGMLTSGGGSIYLANYFDWSVVFSVMAIIGLIGPITILLVKEPNHSKIESDSVHHNYKLIDKTFLDYLLVVAKSFVNITNYRNWYYILLFIFLFKISDSIPNAMSSLFFHDLGFSKVQIAEAKNVSILMMILGTIVGGIIVSCTSFLRGVLYCGILQILSPLSLYIMTYVKYYGVIFWGIQSLQSFVCGVGSTAFIAYLSSLCRGGFTATQFSVIYCFSSISRIGLAWVASRFMFNVSHTWAELFLVTTLLSVCFIFPIWKMGGKLQQQAG